MAIKVANNQSLTAITAIPASITGGAWNLLETQTASDSATINFTSNIDSTYKEYIFRFYDIHPETDDKHFTFQANASGGSGFNETITSTAFRAYQLANGSASALGYRTANDQAQGTGYQRLTEEVGNENSESCCGTLHIYDPSNTTHVTHFISRASSMMLDSGPRDVFVAGYINTTSAITEISFSFTSGDVQAGVIKLYGVS